MTKNRSKSILKKLMSFIMLAALLQALIAAGIILATNVSKTLVDNAYSIFIEKNQNRKAYIESDMINHWSNIGVYRQEILKIYNNIADNEYILTEDKKLDFLEKSTDILIEMFKSSKTTGGYIILNDSFDENVSNTGMYIINGSPDISATTPVDLQMLRGPVEIAKKNKIALTSSWNYGIELNNETKVILDRPIEAAKLTDNIKHLGFWAVIPSLKDNNMKTLTYSQPLIDKNGVAFGVVGIEMSTEYLYKFLPIDEFAATGSYGYTFAIFDKEKLTVMPLILRGTAQRQIIKAGEPLIVKDNIDKENCYTLPTDCGDMSLYIDRLDLYTNNSPYSSNQLYLMGINSTSNMMDFANKLNNAMIIMVLLIVLVGVGVTYFSAFGLAAPIIKLYKEVLQNKPGTMVSLPRVNIKELDNLSIAIEILNKKIVNSVSNTDKILQMAGVGIGSYEYETGDDVIKTSTSLQDMLKIKPTDDSIYTVNSYDFFNKINELKQNPEEENEDTYCKLEKDSNSEAWYRISEIIDGDKTLGVVIDVTKDVLERRALNYQRDYDVLTGIYNRLAFHRISMSIFNKNTPKIAALVMFDLDNLKFINDTYGHEIGDFYIKTSAQLINSTLKKYAVVGRMSGDEFYAYIYGLNSKVEVFKVLGELYKKLDENPIILPDGNKFKIRMSGGVSWYGEDSKDFEELIRFADFAMYEGKHTLKGELREFNKQKYLEESYMLVGKEELNRVLDNQFIEFVFQPIINAKTGDIYGYESLMRPQSELLNSPVKLLQISSAQSCLWKVEKITFFKTMATYVKYKSYFGDAKIFINSIPNENLKSTEYKDFEMLFSEELHNIVIEIIETQKTTLENLETKLQNATRWDAIIALDDYGSGYNGDLSLLETQPQIVKIDKSLIEYIDKDKNRQAMLLKIVDYCKTAGILVLAEGIETYEQLEYLINIGVDLLQGYYISYPIPIPNFDATKIKSELDNLKNK